MNTMSDELAKSLSKENMKNMEALRGGLTSINKGIQTLNTELQKMDVEGQLNTTVSAVTGGLTSIQGSLLNSQTHMGELQTAIGTLKMQLLASGNDNIRSGRFLKEQQFIGSYTKSRYVKEQCQHTGRKF